MVFAGFERVMEACSRINFPAVRLAVKLNRRYPLWFDESLPQDVLPKGVQNVSPVANFCSWWQSKENFCIPLVLEVARREGFDEFVEVAENAMVEVFKTPNFDPTEWEAMEILFEQYLENLTTNKFDAAHNVFLAKMSRPQQGNPVRSKEEQETHRDKTERRLKAIEKSIDENYYSLLNNLVFKGEVASKLVQYQVISQTEKLLIESCASSPEIHARVLILNFIRKRPELWNLFILALKETYSAMPLAEALTSSYNRFMELMAYE